MVEIPGIRPDYTRVPKFNRSPDDRRPAPSRARPGRDSRDSNPRPAFASEAPASREGLTLAIHQELVTALLDVFVGQHRLDKVIERRLRATRDWLPPTRELFVETLHEVVRHWRLRWNRAGLPDADYLQHVNFARTKQALTAQPLPAGRERGWSDAIRASVPDWLHTRGLAELGQKWPAIITALGQPAPLFLRSNALRTDTPALATALANEGFPTSAVTGVGTALRFASRNDVFHSQAFRHGMFEVQDVHSQLIAPLLQVEPGQRVIDACAGSGGKSLHLAALMRNKGRIIALDTVEWKLAELRRRAARAGVDNLEARLIDEPRALKRLAATADRVLVDVPCSGLGVLRRNPDAKWKLREEELDRLRSLQTRLLLDYSRFTKPGGKLVYATCSVLPSENERQVQSFLAANPAWTLEEELHLLPGEHDGDGFYAARLAVGS